MDHLPDRIRNVGVEPDPKSDMRRRYSGDLQWDESNYDRWIVGNADLLCELLRNAGMIDAQSELRVLAASEKAGLHGQVAGVDVILAEVDDDDGSLRRLVLVEDKLLRNSKKREVLAQVLEYGDKIQQKARKHQLSGLGLREKLPKDRQGWFDENTKAIDDCCRTGNFLYVICCDGHDDALIRRIEKLFDPDDPLATHHVCLVELAVYQSDDGKHSVLVPCIAGRWIEAKRTHSIVVKVALGSDGRPAEVSTEKDHDPVVKSGRSYLRTTNEEEYFQLNWKKHGADSIKSCKEVLGLIEKAKIPGVRLGHDESGRPTVMIESTVVGDVLALRVRTGSAALSDGTLTGAWREAPEGRAGRDSFREALLAIPGAHAYGAQDRKVSVPITSFPKHMDGLIRALKDLAKALDAR
jgi:hypothetical protein